MITIKSPQEIKILSEGGKILASILNKAAEKIAPGVSAIEPDNLVRKLIEKAGGKPSFLGFQNYPAALCVSINDEVVHGIPSEDKILKEGDIVSLDLGLEYKKLHTDMALTVGVGKIDEKAQRLINITQQALDTGIKELKDGARIGNYGQAVQSFVEKQGFAVVKNLVGHGVGYSVHEDPDAPNWGRKGEGLELKSGMVLALEPMVCQESGQVILDKDKWTWRTKNGLLSAHFEHTVAIEEQGARVLTKI